MAKRWVIGAIGAFVLLAATGVGFSAFTATATVNGTASAATTGLTVWVGDTHGGYANSAFCDYYLGGARDPNPIITVTPANTWGTNVDVNVSNMVPGDICALPLYVNNTGTVPLNVSLQITNLNSAMCPVWPDLNCYAAGTYSPYFNTNGPLSGTVAPFLAPGASLSLGMFVEFAPFSTSAPAVPGTFEFVFTATAGD